MSKPWSRAATEMQGVHTILATPQWYLNAQLADLLAQGTTADGGSLEDVQLAMKPGGKHWLKGKVGELSVRVLVPGSVGKVVFVVAFASGTMDYVDITSDDPAAASCEVAGLRIGFLVDLARAGVAESDYDALPDPVRKRADSLTKGAFTIERLFLDLENADLAAYDKTATQFPPAMPSSAVAAFQTYLSTYLERIRKADGHVLGYAITAPDWKDPTPSFPPHSIDFVTNEYRDGTDKPQNRAMDTVQYLMMTGAAKLPSNLKPWWGNLIQPADGVDNAHYGTVAMAKALFVDGYLLPRLAPLVCGYWKVSDNGDGLDLVASDATGTFTATADGGRWSSPPVTAKTHRTNTFSNDDMTYTYAWDVRLRVIPGTNTISITRTVDFDISYTHWYGVENHAVTAGFRVWYRVPLTITVTILGAVDGKLQVSATSELPQSPPDTLYDLPYGWLVTDYREDSASWTAVQDQIDTYVDRAIDVSLTEAMPAKIAATLAHELNVAPFIFPGGAQLSMIDPLFNDEGDLLMGTSAKS